MKFIDNHYLRYIVLLLYILFGLKISMLGRSEYMEMYKLLWREKHGATMFHVAWDLQYIALCLAGLLVYLTLLFKSDELFSKGGSLVLLVANLFIFILILTCT